MTECFLFFYGWKTAIFQVTAWKIPMLFASFTTSLLDRREIIQKKRCVCLKTVKDGKVRLEIVFRKKDEDGEEWPQLKETKAMFEEIIQDNCVCAYFYLSRWFGFFLSLYFWYQKCLCVVDSFFFSLFNWMWFFVGDFFIKAPHWAFSSLEQSVDCILTLDQC